MRIILLNILIVMLVACSSTGKDTAVEAKSQKLEITFSQSACFGKCKVFKMMLSNEQVYLNAMENTPMLGEYTGELDSKELDSLRNFVSQNELFKNSEVEMVDQEITDLPFCTMVIKLGDKQKTIKYRNQAPKHIKYIDTFLRAMLIDLNRWESKK